MRKGVKGVCKLKLGPMWPTEKGFGSKIFWLIGPDARAVKVLPPENTGILISGFFSLKARISAPISNNLSEMTKYQLDIVLSFHLQKNLGQLIKKWPSCGAFRRANLDLLKNTVTGHIRYFVAILKLGQEPQFWTPDKNIVLFVA